MARAGGGERKRGAAGTKKASAAKKASPAKKPAATKPPTAANKPATAARKSAAAKPSAAARKPATSARRSAAAKPSAAAKKPATSAKKPATSARRSAAKKPTAGKPAATKATPRKPAAAKAAPEKAAPARKRAASPASAKRAVPAKASTAKRPAVGPQPAAAPGAERTQAVEAAARSYFEAIAARDFAAAASHWHPEGINDLVPLGVFRGPEAVQGLFREMFASMPDMTMAVDRVTADPEGAAVQWRLAGTFSGAPFQGIEPTGRRVELRGTDCLEIDEQGKVRRNTGYYDGAAFARAIGMLPPQDSGAERAMRTGFNAVTKLRSAVRSR